MAPVVSIVASMLALTSATSARVFSPSGVHATLHQSRDELVSVRGENFDGFMDDAPVIRRRDDPDVLQPVRPSTKVSATGLAESIKESSPVGIRKDHTLRWAGKENTEAELDVRFKGDAEGFVDAEYFDDIVDSFTCPKEGSDGSIEIHFKSQADFDTAADVWDWVNVQDDRHFIFMLGAGDCGWNQDRVLYHIASLKYEDERETAILAAKSVTWKEAVHTYKLNIGKRKQEDLAARDITPEFSVPIDIDLTGKGFSNSFPGVDILGSCVNCTVNGSFDIEATFSVGFFEIDEASVTLSTPGIEAVAIISATIRGEIFGKELSKPLTLFTASPAGVAIPGLVTIGPVVSLDIVPTINAIKGGVTVTMGGTATIPPSSSTIDFINEDGNTSEGWEVQTDSVPMEVDTFIEARASIALSPSLGVEVSVFESGFAFKLVAETPALAATLRAIHSFTCNACDKFENAIQGTLQLTASIGVNLQKMVGGSFESLWSFTFFDASAPPLAEFCEPVGPQGDCAINGTWAGATLH